MFVQYLNNPEAYEKKLELGFFQTGDNAYRMVSKLRGKETSTGELMVEGRVADLVAHHQANLEKIFLNIIGYQPQLSA